MPEDPIQLKQEIETYDKHLPEWKDMEGQFVLIRETEIIGFYDDYVEAVRAGYTQFGIIPFLVKKVVRHQPAHNITRLFTPRLAR